MFLKGFRSNDDLSFPYPFQGTFEEGDDVLGANSTPPSSPQAVVSKKADPFPTPPPLPEQTADKTQVVAQNKIWAFVCDIVRSTGDFLCGIFKSRIFRALAVAGLGVLATFFLLTPPGWVVTALGAAGVFVAVMLAQIASDRGASRISFELGHIKRMFKSRNYDEILIPLPNGNLQMSGIYLGALPNRLTRFLEGFKGKICAVLSINSAWEREPLGLSNPYKEADLKKLNIDYLPINVEDHEYLSFEELDQAAEFIHKQLTDPKNKGKKVYVHCKAGQSRSALAVAAYLIKFKGMTADEASACIKQSRPCSRIDQKLDPKTNKHGKEIPGLRAYADKIRPPASN